MLGVAGTSIYRNEGRYIIVITLIVAYFINRKQWKSVLLGLFTCVVCILAVEGIYMPSRGIGKGSVGEMLSIPLQQTARYVQENYDEIPIEESEALDGYFGGNVAVLKEVYNPEVSDPVKDLFTVTSMGDELNGYFRIWLKGLMKDPDTYIQAFFNQTYGYFYLGKEHFWDSICRFEMLYGQKWSDQCVDVGFVIEDTTVRKNIEDMTIFLQDIPFVSLLFRPAAYVYMVLGCTWYLLYNKKYRDILILLPGLLVVMVSIVSPVNAYLRYLLPLVAVMPLYFAWIYYVHSESKFECSDNNLDKQGRMQLK